MKKFTRYFPAFLFFLLLPIFSFSGIYKQFSALQCDSLIKANALNPNFVILDVRTPGEYDGGHLTGSINRSTGLTDFTAQLAALPKHKTFLLHCQSGGRSASTFAKMKELNFAEVYEMIGGMNSWKGAGLPTTTQTQPKLMLVSANKKGSSASADSVSITITNRANGKLTFSNAFFRDAHPVSNNFNLSKTVEGAEDYLFTIVHSPHYPGVDTTRVKLESNGGLLDFNVVFKNGVIQGIHPVELPELRVFPNPAKDMLFVNSHGESLISEIRVLHINGQVVLTQNGLPLQNGIDISHLNNGLYIVHLKIDNNWISKKIIIRN